MSAFFLNAPWVSRFSQSGRSLANAAAVAAPSGVVDTNALNDTATDTDTLTGSANLSITASDAPDPVTAGAALAYTINVANAGPSNAASLTMTDSLPAGVTFVSASGTGWTCSNVGMDPAAGVATPPMKIDYQLPHRALRSSAARQASLDPFLIRQRVLTYGPAHRQPSALETSRTSRELRVNTK